MSRRGILIITDDSLTQRDTKEPLPARELFEGSFQEVRTFESRTRDQRPTTLRIVSVEHGLVDGDERIEPYTTNEARNGAIRSAVDDIRKELARPWAAIVLLLKSEVIRELVESPVASTVSGHVVFVGADSFAEPVRRALGVAPEAFHAYRRVGVARIGRENQDAIVRLLEDVLA